MSKPGRLRIRTAAILQESHPDWDVQPEDVQPAQGFYRIRTRWFSGYRWELWTRTKAGKRVISGCFLTLADFIRRADEGCHIDEDGVIQPRPRPPLTRQEELRRELNED